MHARFTSYFEGEANFSFLVLETKTKKKAPLQCVATLSLLPVPC
jgi:hypothetical protein